jgi:hypothetical protein
MFLFHSQNITQLLSQMEQFQGFGLLGHRFFYIITQFLTTPTPKEISEKVQKYLITPLPTAGRD